MFGSLLLEGFLFIIADKVWWGGSICIMDMGQEANSELQPSKAYPSDQILPARHHL